jgi:hypothetical protein
MNRSLSGFVVRAKQTCKALRTEMKHSCASCCSYPARCCEDFHIPYTVPTKIPLVHLTVSTLFVSALHTVSTLFPQAFMLTTVRHISSCGNCIMDVCWIPKKLCVGIHKIAFNVIENSSCENKNAQSNMLCTSLISKIIEFARAFVS